MRIVQLYIGEKLIAEYPDAFIVQDDNWTQVYPNGMKREDRDFQNALVTVPASKGRCSGVSIISVLQEPSK
jgi:hypothetical protein